MSDSSRQSTDCCWCYPYNNSIILNEKTAKIHKVIEYFNCLLVKAQPFIAHCRAQMCPASWVLPRSSWGLRETTTNMSTLNLPSGVIKRGMLENQPFFYGISHCHVWLPEDILFYTWDKSKSNCESTHQIWQTKNKTNQIEVFQVDPQIVEVFETRFHFHRISWN